MRCNRPMPEATFLTCIDGPDRGLVIPVHANHALTLGRSGTPITDPQVSREHCEVLVHLTRRRMRMQVIDKQSANGTYSGKPLRFLPGFAYNRYWLRRRTRAHIKTGGVIGIGKNLFQWEVSGLEVSIPVVVDALQAPKRTRFTWQKLFYFLPLLSIGWLLWRFISAWGAAAFIAAILLSLLYWSLARRSHIWHVPLLATHQALELKAAEHSENPSNLKNQLPLNLNVEPEFKRRYIFTILMCRRKRPRRRDTHIAWGASISVLGEKMESWQLWIAHQILLQARYRGLWDCTVTHAEPQERESKCLVVKSGAQTLARIGKMPNARVVLKLAGPPPIITANTALKQSAREQTLPSRLQVTELPTIKAEPGSLAVPIGAGIDTLDIVRDGPHALVAGTTGSGKSEALRTWIMQMARYYPPDRLQLVLFDYKGGATFSKLAQLPHCVGLVTDLTPRLAIRAIQSLDYEIRQREIQLSEYGYADLSQWEKAGSAPARILLVIDEFHAVVRTHPEVMDSLVDMAARGRSLGIHLIAGTQSPGGVITAQMRANLTLRICLRTAQVSQSLDILGVDDAAKLPRIPGRAIIDTGQLKTIQWAYCDVAPTSVSKPRTHAGTALWKPPLPAVVSERFVKQTLALTPADAAVPFALADNPQVRAYTPLKLPKAPVAIVAEPDSKNAAIAHINQYLQVHASDRAVLRVDEREDLEATLYQLERAWGTDRPIIIPDLSTLIEAMDDEWGHGSGKSIWKRWAKRNSGITIVGLDPSDLLTTRELQYVLASITPTQAQLAGLDRDQVQMCEALSGEQDAKAGVSLMTLRWRHIRTVSVALTQVSPPVKTLQAAEKPEERTPSLTVDALVEKAENTTIDSLIILGYTSEAVEETAREATEELQVELQKYTGLELGMQSEGIARKMGRALTIVGEVEGAAMRALRPPLYARTHAHNPQRVWVVCEQNWLRYWT